MLVRPRSIALGAAVLAAVYLAVLYLYRPVPDRILALVGGPTGVDRVGGLRMRWRAPAGVSLDKVMERERTGVQLSRSGDELIVEVPGIAEEEIGHTARMAASGGDLDIRAVVDGDFMAQAAQAIGADFQPDLWRPDDGGPTHHDMFLQASSRQELDDMIRRARAAGWAPPPNTDVLYEKLRSRYEDGPPMWRTYVVSREELLPEDPIAHAETAVDPYTERPIVLLDFTREAGRAFGDATARYAGHKLATIIDGLVVTAPIINGPIRGGRASVTMGSGSAVQQERDAEMLAAALNVGHLPRGGDVLAVQYVAPAGPTSERIAIGLIAVVGGLLAGVAGFVLVRLVRPRWRPSAPGLPGKAPLLRLAVTLVLPVIVVYFGTDLALPHLNDVELGRVVIHGGGNHAVGLEAASLLALGLTPLFVAFALVELVVVIAPAWRPLRHTAAGRRKLGRPVAALAIVLALVQGYFLAVYFSAMSRMGAEIVDRPGMATNLLIAVTVAAGMLVLVITAAIIAQRGLGNGYGPIIVTTLAFSLWNRVMLGGELAIPSVLATVVVGIVTAVVLHWRVGDDDETPIQLPASGLAPLSGGADALALLWLVAPAIAAPVGDLLGTRWIVPVVAVGWAFAFARPRLFAVASRLNKKPPSRRTWWRAAGASAAVLGALVLVGNTDAIATMIVVATLVDIADDWRGRRGDATPVWPLHQVQHLPLVEQALAGANVPYHVSQSNLRGLLAFFGPWAPVIIYVPRAHAERAEGRIRAVFDPSLPAPSVADAFA